MNCSNRLKLAYLMIYLACLITNTFANIFINDQDDGKIFIYGIQFYPSAIGKLPYGSQIVNNASLSEPLENCTQMAPAKTPILITYKKFCSLSTKVYNAGQSGAEVIIIIDANSDEILHYSEEPFHHVKSTKPVLIIGRIDGDKLVSMIKKSPLGQLSLQIILPNQPSQSSQNEKLEVRYWLNSFESYNYRFIYTFKELFESIQQIEDRMSFEPHIAVYLDPKAQQYNFSNISPKCLSGGRYCTTEPEGGNKGGYVGQDGVWQDLITLCVWKLYPTSWFDFMINFNEICLKNSSNIPENTTQCSEKAMTMNQEINQKKIWECKYKDFVGKKDPLKDDNVMLRDEFRLFNEESQQIWPALYVNKRQIQGDLGQRSLLFSAICSAYTLDSYPLTCKQYYGLDSSGIVSGNNQDGNSKPSGLSYTIIFAVILPVGIILLSVSLYLYRRYARIQEQQKLDFKVNASITKYMSMKDTA